MMAMRSEGSLYLMDNRIEQLSSIGLYVAMKQQSGSQWFSSSSAWLLTSADNRVKA